jgi:hypothetical protein
MSRSSVLKIRPDHLCGTYQDVEKVGFELASMFYNHVEYNGHAGKDILVANLAEAAKMNNFGFNLSNFTPKLIDEFFADVVSDYERSFVGSFAQALFWNLEHS